jgi:hypothetical protein
LFWFADKLKSLDGFPLNIVWSKAYDTLRTLDGRFINKYEPFIRTIAEQMNASMNVEEVIEEKLNYLLAIDKVDFVQRAIAVIIDLTYQEHHDYCFVVPMPPKYSIYELILILPLDKSCWIWLSVVVAISTIVWKFYGCIEEPRLNRALSSHWDFLFETFGFFLLQSRKLKMWVRIFCTIRR